jgi:hypothetical protein
MALVGIVNDRFDLTPLRSFRFDPQCVQGGRSTVDHEDTPACAGTPFLFEAVTVAVDVDHFRAMEQTIEWAEAMMASAAKTSPHSANALLLVRLIGCSGSWR